MRPVSHWYGTKHVALELIFRLTSALNSLLLARSAASTCIVYVQDFYEGMCHEIIRLRFARRCPLSAVSRPCRPGFKRLLSGKPTFKFSLVTSASDPKPTFTYRLIINASFIYFTVRAVSRCFFILSGLKLFTTVNRGIN